MMETGSWQQGKPGPLRSIIPSGPSTMRRAVAIRFACDTTAFMRGCQDLCRIYTQRIRTAISKDLKPFSERDAGNLMTEPGGR